MPVGSGTEYALDLVLDDSQIPGSSQAFNNHIPVDTVLDGVVAISKTTPSINVSRGDLVPYTITFNNTEDQTLPALTLVDQFPPGFRYIKGSARLDGNELEPTTSRRPALSPRPGDRSAAHRMSE